MPKKKTAAIVTPSLTAAPQPLKAQAAGGNSFGSVAFSSNRAVIYGQAADFSVDYQPSDRLEMIKRIRYGERNYGLVRQVFNDYVLYGIGDGITPQAAAAQEDVAAEYEAWFKAWAANVSTCGRFSLYDIQRIVLRGALRDGDSFVILVIDEGRPRLQVIEAHRVGNPIGQPIPAGMVDGVQFDSKGRLVGYNILQGDNSSRLFPASAVCHIAELDWVSGSRGLPILQHSWTDIQTEDELLRLEMLAVRNDADVTRVLHKNNGFIPQDMKAELEGPGSSASLESVASKMGGKLLALEPGESLSSLASNRPSPVFAGFLKSIQADILRGTLPYEFVGDPSSISGSGVRLITAKADRVFSRWQQVIIDKLCQKVWGFAMGFAVANGEVPEGDWANVSWTTPKRLTVDAGREAANDRADVELGLLSMSELYSARGLDFRQEQIKRAKDFRFIFDLAKKEGIPTWTLYKPGFNWLQEGEGKPTATEAALQGVSLSQPAEQPPAE
jgi:capsid protein